ncbi:NCS2 family permease [Kordiimonas sp. SCSIO 12610]|uniref:NCS2 family permease n=1 Tax=Kordiimonas sp. SCSIO 12610 TaxID=2829597 RepID=UPI002108CCDC|nr:NCS2 family permease [Kordiimonas sp. SCSIO 12610]UTW54596.1 NCS2 family permease [Kordiimonas sp. SCSIO 12610]
MQNYFQLSKNGTTFSRELVAGLTTFSTMAYIVIVSPSLLSQTGMDFQAVTIATCLAAFIGCVLSGLLSNYPFAQAPGIGLSAFFVYGVVLGGGYTWQGALAIVFISGLVFIILTATGLRRAILNAIPESVRQSVPVGIGLFITLIGLNNAGVVDINQGPIIDIVLSNGTLEQSDLIGKITNAPPQILEFGNFAKPEVYLTLLGLAVIIGLSVHNVSGAILIGVGVVSFISFLMGGTELPNQLISSSFDISPIFLQLDFSAIWGASGFTLSALFDIFFIVLAFTMVDLLDTVGTLYGTAERGGFLDEDGKLPRINSAMMADSVATTIGALVGTSTVTTYLESGSGIAAGGKTGLAAIIVGILFLLCIPLSPLVALIPTSATSAALVMVGILMIGSVSKIDFSKLEVVVPSFLVIVLMPFSYSIANGIGAGIIAYVFIKIIQGELRSLHPVTCLIAILFVLRYAII